MYVQLVGASWRTSNEQLALASCAKGHPVSLIREPDNAHDANAIKVLVDVDGTDYHVGYIPREAAVYLAPEMDTQGVDGYGYIIQPGKKAMLEVHVGAPPDVE